MEVKGQKKQSSSDRIYCGPCGSKGTRVQAKGYCQDCQEYLCDNCYNVHTVPRPLENHVLIDAAHMPKPMAGAECDTSRSDIKWTVTCKKHPGKLVEVFCLMHNEAMCALCAFDGHRSCNAEYIKDAARDYDNNDEYLAFMATIELIEEDIDHSSDLVDKNSDFSDRSHEKAIQELDAIKDTIEKKVKELRDQGEQMKCDDEALKKDLHADLKAMKARITEIKMITTKSSSDVGDLYIMCKSLAREVENIQRKLAETANKNTAHSYIFECETFVEHMLSTQTPIGKIIKSESTTVSDTTKELSPQVKHRPAKNQRPETVSLNLSTASVQRLSGINVKCPQDKGDCWISGSCLLSSSTLLLTDCENKFVKVVDTCIGTVTSSLQLTSAPRDVAALPLRQAAVTMPKLQQVQIISTEPKLALIRSMDVNGKCCGIDSTPDHLAVAYKDPGKVEIMGHSGELFKTIGKGRMERPCYVKIHREGKNDMVYVSDIIAHSVSKWSLDGELISRYTDEDLFAPRGIAITVDGQILVNNWKTHSIHLISSKGRMLRTLLEKKDGIEYPYTICYCAQNNRLYISSSRSGLSAEMKDNLKIYQLQQVE